jgi:hypothetical protein
LYSLTQFLHVIVVYTHSGPLYSLTQFLHVIVVYVQWSTLGIYYYYM